MLSFYSSQFLSWVAHRRHFPRKARSLIECASAIHRFPAVALRFGLRTIWAFLGKTDSRRKLSLRPAFKGRKLSSPASFSSISAASTLRRWRLRRGSDLVALATAEPIEYKLITQPNVKTVKELRGKKIVVDRVGGTSYYISLQILEKVGLKTGDVELVQVGGGGNQRVAAFKSGLVSGVVTSTDRFEQLKIPYHVLADAMEMGIKVMGNSYLTTRSFRDQNKDVVLRTMRALVQGRRWAKDPKNRQEVLRIYNRYLPSTEPSFMDHLYRKKRGADSALSVHECRRSAYFPLLLDRRESNFTQFEADGVCR